jgi:predicted lipoprotein
MPTRFRLELLFAVCTLALSVPAVGALFSACEVQPDPPSADRQQVLRDLVNNVIVPNYNDVTSSTAALVGAVSALRAAPSMETLTAAQAAYRSARAQQKTTEAYLLGPADDLTITGEAIDSWPADKTKLDALLAAATPVDAMTIGTLGTNQRGFPALEYLLFDSSVSDAEVLARFTQPGSGARRAELAESMATDLTAVCKRVSDAMAGPEGYGHQLAEAGMGSKLYASQSEGVDKVVTALVYLSELVVLKKLSKPLGVDMNNVVQPAQEEGPRSDSSIADLRSDLAGIRAIYTGERGAISGQGLATAVRAINPGAAMRFEAALAATVSAVDAIPPPLRTALTQNRAAVDAAYEAFRALKTSLVTDVAGALAASIGFGFSDTD